MNFAIEFLSHNSPSDRMSERGNGNYYRNHTEPTLPKEQKYSDQNERQSRRYPEKSIFPHNKVKVNLMLSVVPIIDDYLWRHHIILLRVHFDSHSRLIKTL